MLQQLATLSAHSPRFKSRSVTLEDLRALPAPATLGARHRPIPHAALVDALYDEFDRREVAIRRSQFALSGNDGSLFGVLDLQLLQGGAERSLAFGFRNSTDSSLALRAVAGNRVFVCDNLALSGDVFAIQRKNTTFMDLRSTIAVGFDKFLSAAQRLRDRIARIADTPLTDTAAKVAIYDAFEGGVVPIRLFDDVNRHYFQPDADATDCQPRTLWGVHNAFTRSVKALTPGRQFSATVSLGAHFGL
jgi:hypothetical protein